MTPVDGTQGRHDPRLVAFLEGLQKHSGRRPLDLKPLSDNEIRNIVDQVAERRFDGVVPETFRTYLSQHLRAGWALRSPSRYELPFYYSNVRHYFDDIHSIAGSSGFALAEVPLIATMDSGSVNAMCVKPPDPIPGMLLLFETELFAFTSAMVRAYVNCLPSVINSDGWIETDYNLDAVAQRIEQTPEVRQQFVLPILTYAALGNPSRIPHLALDGAREQMASTVEQAVGLFVMGHEYGHLVDGHLDKPTPAFVSEDPAKTFAYSWAHELQADLIGLRLAIPAVGKRLDVDASVAVMSACLYFAFLDLMDRAVSFLATGRVEAIQLGSHPPPNTRIENLRERLPLFISGDAHLFEAATRGAEQELRIVGLLWEMTLPRLKLARDLGARPWSRWRVG